MDALRGWTLSVCLACVAAGIVQHLTGARTKEPVIKLVLSLYILITALAPLKQWSVSASDFLPQEALAPAAPVDTQGLAVSQTGAALSQTLDEAFAREGFLCQVEVELSAFDGQVQVQRVAVTGDVEANTARGIVRQELGAEVPVSVAGQAGEEG